MQRIFGIFFPKKTHTHTHARNMPEGSSPAAMTLPQRWQRTSKPLVLFQARLISMSADMPMFVNHSNLHEAWSGTFRWNHFVSTPRLRWRQCTDLLLRGSPDVGDIFSCWTKQANNAPAAPRLPRPRDGLEGRLLFVLRGLLRRNGFGYNAPLLSSPSPHSKRGVPAATCPVRCYHVIF